MTALQDTVGVLDYADASRLNIRLPQKRRLEQYFSSAPLARLMASMMDYSQDTVSILDPGAGVGSLFAACAETVCGMEQPPRRMSVTTYEVDPALADNLSGSLERTRALCEDRDIHFSGSLVKGDFITDYCHGVDIGGFTHIIMNPPYGKINVSSDLYGELRRTGIQTTNLYAAFIAIAQNLLNNEGQMVFISPRSFCNGVYFDRFRDGFLESMAIRRIHLFDSRMTSFHNDGVLQENVVIYATKHGHPGIVTISSSSGPEGHIKSRQATYSEMVFNDDPRRFIHIVPDTAGSKISSVIRGLKCTLDDLGLDVSTGKVVDFRIRSELRHDVTDGTVPLVRPFNISSGIAEFPILGRKHQNFIVSSEKSKKLLVENGTYILVKRFTTVEERRRVVAAMWTSEQYETNLLGFENRINYFHQNGSGLDDVVAKGLWMFLNSTMVDSYFRQFNGSTQVNATDLRYIRYPSVHVLKRLGSTAPDVPFKQKRLDDVVEGLLLDT